MCSLHEITELLLELALSINQSINKIHTKYMTSVPVKVNLQIWLAPKTYHAPFCYINIPKRKPF